MRGHKIYNEMAKYYDIIYAKSGKIDYFSLVKFLNYVLKKHGCRKILDVGCGTGTATDMLHKLGYDIQGTDLSSSMLAIAKKKNNKIRFFQSDMRNIRTREKFDAAFISFRSFAYMTTNEDVERVIKSVNGVLKKGGLFIFDNFSAYHMLKDKIKRGSFLYKDQLEAKDKNISITRNSQSVTDVKDGVKWRWTYEYVIKDGKKTVRKKETALLRAFFLSELETMLKYNGFKILNTYGDYKLAKFDDQINLIIVVKKVE